MITNRLRIGDRVYDTKGYIWTLDERHATMEHLWNATREHDGYNGILDEADLETLGERKRTDDEIELLLGISNDYLEELIDIDEPEPNHSTDPELEQYMRLLKKLVSKKDKGVHPLYPEDAEK